MKVVVERAFRIDADNFDLRIFLFEKFAGAADRAARAHAAHKMGDFAFAVFPDLRTGGAVMRFGVVGVVVLIGVIRIVDFARQFFATL